MERKIHNYNDEWIVDNWRYYRNWNTMCDEHNRLFNTDINYNSFKSHCYRIGLNYHYSEEQLEWLRTNYPILGKNETVKQFNIIFNENRTTGGIKQKCTEMGLLVTDDRRKARAIENTERFHKKGDIVLNNGYYCIKRPEDGKWQRLHRYIWEKENGPIPSGHKVIFLDNNNENLSIENLALVPYSYLAIMNKYNMKSEHPEITRTSVKWCELYLVVKKATY